MTHSRCSVNVLILSLPTSFPTFPVPSFSFPFHLFLLPPCYKWLVPCIFALLYPTFWSPMDCSPPGSSVHEIFKQEYRKGLPFPPPGIFPTQRSNPHLLCLMHWQMDSLPLVPPGLYVTNRQKIGKSVSAAATAKLLQSCLTLCDPRDGSPPGSPVPGILQARTLEWVAISFFNAWK